MGWLDEKSAYEREVHPAANCSKFLEKATIYVDNCRRVHGIRLRLAFRRVCS